MNQNDIRKVIQTYMTMNEKVMSGEINTFKYIITKI